MFISALLVAVAGIIFFNKTSFVRVSPLDLLIPKSAPVEEKIIEYPFQTLLIDTPFAAALPIHEPIFPDHICSIADYGAIADRKTLNTDAFRKAIESCADAGGGKVIVPPGIWLTGAIHLKNNIELQIERDATVLFSANFNDYLPVVFSRFEGIEYYNYSPPIFAENCTNVAVTGVGTLNGQGPAWWKLKDRATPNIEKLYALGDDEVPLSQRIFGTETAGLRPAFIEFVNCSNALIENVNIVNGPMWTIHPLYSNNVIVRGVNVATNPGPSTDGIAIDSSTNVLVENSTFDTGDDAIVLKSGRDKEGMRLHRPTENIVIRNNTIKDAHSAIAIGSEMSGDVRNVLVADTNIRTAQYGFRVKATKGRGGIVENIWVEDMNIYSTSIESLQITTSYGLPFSVNSQILPQFKNIHLKNITVRKTRQAINVDGLAGLPISDISFENIIFATREGIELSNTDAVRFKNIQGTFKENDPFFIISDSKNITLESTFCPIQTPLCLSIHGDTTENINIQNSGIPKGKIKSDPNVKSDAIIYQPSE